jgi:plastocyanin
MRFRPFAPLLVFSFLVSVSGCGDDEGDATSATSATSASASSSSTSSSGGGASIHDCDRATAEDQTGQAAVTIAFPTLEYTPACLRVKAGTAVTFMGDLASHPLVGGEYEDGIKTPDEASPIKASSGMSVTFTLSDPGVYPYYCDIHYSIGMKGAIFVE